MFPFPTKNTNEEELFSPSKPLKVIASFSIDGNIKPLYVENEEGNRIRVDRITSCKKDGYGTEARLEFTCLYTVDDMQKGMTVKYNIHSHVWFL